MLIIVLAEYLLVQYWVNLHAFLALTTKYHLTKYTNFSPIQGKMLIGQKILFLKLKKQSTVIDILK